jgi:hypothetical protein
MNNRPEQKSFQRVVKCKTTPPKYISFFQPATVMCMEAAITHHFNLSSLINAYMASEDDPHAKNFISYTDTTYDFSPMKDLVFWNISRRVYTPKPLVDLCIYKIAHLLHVNSSLANIDRVPNELREKIAECHTDVSAGKRPILNQSGVYW